MGGGRVIAIRNRLEAIEADITTLRVGAIVNAANSALLPGGGVDGAIRRGAGPEIDEDLYRIGGCREGEAVVTQGYRLPAEFVIHTVAPIWAGGAARAAQEMTLARCYENGLKLADEKTVRTLAFPAIGTGAYRWPADAAARIAFDTVVAHLGRCEVQTRVFFCCFSRADKERYETLIAALRE
jgi:O-acetyl-ADP-ribose deacetylase (regulator of RNase III)